ncbi:hypothetical protein G4B88_030765 [Cannabis sativa]|uniref:Uncharacterized protein n=1 Tax=Cannabis sativa TaxID=3483 RepID=A0A7J6H8M8_CANSA|nr:hypothetical protein G4B88_030765 [Cannabis sativa]
MSNWGAHFRTNNPRFFSLARSSNPSGNHSGLNSPFKSKPSGGLMTQTKGFSLFSSPIANSIIWVAPIVFWEPNAMYRTDLGSCESSHSNNLSADILSLEKLEEEREEGENDLSFNTALGRSGQTHQTGRLLPSGSISSTVLHNRACDLRLSLNWVWKNFDHESEPSAALKK